MWFAWLARCPGTPELKHLHAPAGAVVSTAFNPRMFHLPESKAKPDGPANGKENITYSDALTNVFATGGQDRRVVGEWDGSGEGVGSLYTSGWEGHAQRGCCIFCSGVTMHTGMLTACQP